MKPAFPDTFGGRVVVRDVAKAEALVRAAEEGRPLEQVEEQRRLCFEVGKRLHLTLKTEAAKRGIPMRSLILDALHAYGIRE